MHYNLYNLNLLQHNTCRKFKLLGWSVIYCEIWHSFWRFFWSVQLPDSDTDTRKPGNKWL